ncbi:MAG: hypothetical protein EA397_15415 [Deltaproteobacteria bacterium]|nr:MAG: hypothetical protein EA397_15415 [Deltaproteobacteria bacterium]
MWPCLREGVWSPGGIVSYPLENIFKEVAFIAYHFHWSRDEALSISHRERHAWVKEISAINERINKSR